MAIKATIFKATVELSDLDRQVYRGASTVIAQHPSENNQRLMVRLLAYALNLPSEEENGPLEFAKDMWDPDEPALWQKDLTGKMLLWIEVGQPDEKRVMRVSARSQKVSVYSFGPQTWWAGISSKISRVQNVDIWHIEQSQSLALAALAQRTMQLQVTVQDGAVYVSDETRSVEVTPLKLFGR
jgi:uncharacterized protein YaeQ